MPEIELIPTLISFLGFAIAGGYVWLANRAIDQADQPERSPSRRQPARKQDSQVHGHPVGAH